MRCPVPCSSLVHQEPMREDGECPCGLCFPFPKKQFAVIRIWSPFHPFHWARLRGNSCALRLRVFCFSVSSQKLFANSSEDFLCPSRNADPRLGSRPLSRSSAPITRAKGDSKNVRESRRTNGLFGKEPGEQIHEESGADARQPLSRHQDLVEGQGRAAPGKNRVASHHRLEWPRGIRGGQTEEGRPPVCRRDAREQRLREGGRQREEQIQSEDHGVANQGVFDSQAGPEGNGADSAGDGENAARGDSLLNLATKKRLRRARSLFLC